MKGKKTHVPAGGVKVVHRNATQSSHEVSTAPNRTCLMTRTKSVPLTQKAYPGAHVNIFPSGPSTSLLVPSVLTDHSLSSKGMCHADKVQLGRPTSHVKEDSQLVRDDSDGDSYGYIVPDCDWKPDNSGCGQQYNQGTSGMESVPALGVVQHLITSNAGDIYSDVCELAEVHIESHN